MNTTNKVLAGLFAAQAVLVALTWSAGSDGPDDDAAPLIEAKKEDVGKLVITGKPAKAGETPDSVTLVRKGEGWVVGTADDFPADTKKVDEVLDKLLDARVRAPVANNKANHNALEVGDRAYAKKVELTIDGKPQAFVVGNAKGTSVHVRRADQDAVYLARGVSAWGLSERVRSYVDPDYVKVEEPTEVQVTQGTRSITVVKDDKGDWRVNELPADADVDQSRVRSFVSSARSVQLAEPVGKTVEPAYGLGDEATVVTLRKEDGETIYRIGAADDDAFYVKAEGNDYVVKVNKYAVETLTTQTPDKFIKSAEPAPQPGGMPGMPGMPPPGSDPAALMRGLGGPG